MGNNKLIRLREVGVLRLLRFTKAPQLSYFFLFATHSKIRFTVKLSKFRVKLFIPAQTLITNQPQIKTTLLPFLKNSVYYLLV
jgi:hypothetical protein